MAKYLTLTNPLEYFYIKSEQSTQNNTLEELEGDQKEANSIVWSSSFFFLSSSFF